MYSSCLGWCKNCRRFFTILYTSTATIDDVIVYPFCMYSYVCILRNIQYLLFKTVAAELLSSSLTFEASSEGASVLCSANLVSLAVHLLGIGCPFLND